MSTGLVRELAALLAKHGTTNVLAALGDAADQLSSHHAGASLLIDAERIARAMRAYAELAFYLESRGGLTLGDMMTSVLDGEAVLAAALAEDLANLSDKDSCACGCGKRAVEHNLCAQCLAEATVGS